jgi:hypothetical protein
MADEPGRRPLLNPVLRFTKKPRPEGITGGGKNASGIKTDRLDKQRTILSEQFKTLAETANDHPKFGDRLVVYASMFDDSLAATWTPGDLFNEDRGSRLIAPFRNGYLVEIERKQLRYYSALSISADTARDKVDISRVKSLRFFETEDAAAGRKLDDMWEEAPEFSGGRAFIVWLMPFTDKAAAEDLLVTIGALRDGVIAPPPPLLAGISASDRGTSPAMRRGLLAVQSGDRLNIAMREFRQTGRAKTTVTVPSHEALVELAGSGAVFRLEPVSPITTTSPGEGKEPNRPLPLDMQDLPIVGVVDGGLTASSYQQAQAWKAPSYVKDSHADTKHGNLVSSLVIQGHDWNNNLSLPALYCQVGTVQAVPKPGSGSVDPLDFIAYLDAVMGAHPETKVWNFSLNQKQPCDMDNVSLLGHEIAVLARKHAILPIISVGNKPGERLQPPADCEAAITIGGRQHTSDGSHGEICPVSLPGPGPCCMLKPDLSHFSHVRALGGVLITGSSFSTALTSPLAAHTMARLRDPSPDLVKALMLHNIQGDGFDPTFGFGSPVPSALPWECKPGVVTLQWTASLRPGAAYYWELPIPAALRASGKLKGHGALTAIVNPHPLVTDIAGPNYFSVRLATALQFTRSGKSHNLLGSLDTDKIAEQEARTVDHKWSPIRHHKKEFHGKGFEGDNLRVYARIYARDLYLYDYKSLDEVPPMDTVFVLSLGTGDEDDDVYHEMRDQLGAFVENATIDTHIDIENEGE